MRENIPKSWKDRGFDFINNIYAGIALMVLCAVAGTIYARYGALWERPIIDGLATGAIALSLFLSLRAVLSLPVATAKATPENVGDKVLDWLHKFGLTVKRCQDETDCDFFFIVTTDGGKKIVVKRHLKYFPDYITVTGLITLTDEEKKIVARLGDAAKFEALFAAQKELWRGQFGFNSTKYDSDGLTIFDRVPITAHIAETDVLRIIWKMEAILGCIIAINARFAMQHTTRVPPQVLSDYN